MTELRRQTKYWHFFRIILKVTLILALVHYMVRGTNHGIFTRQYFARKRYTLEYAAPFRCTLTDHNRTSSHEGRIVILKWPSLEQ